MLIAARDENGHQLTDEELRDQLVSLLLLGYETTAGALSWAFYLIHLLGYETTAGALSWAFYLIHSTPHVLEKLLQELAKISVQTPEAIAQLPYLTAVCQETLRIHPIALICTPRMVKDSVQIDGDNFTTGTVIVPCIYLAHRRSETFINPQEFAPERFLNRKYSPYEYLPFGGGVRGCIGTAFSMYEMKLVIATILSRFELLRTNLSPVHPVRRGITIVPSASGVKMVVTAQRQLSVQAVY